MEKTRTPCQLQLTVYRQSIEMIPLYLTKEKLIETVLKLKERSCVELSSSGLKKENIFHVVVNGVMHSPAAG